jgi:RNA polymerase sigma-70 factor (ECF subfamily)
LQDKELVALFKEGSHQAFDELYIRYKDRLMNFCRYSLRQDKDRAEDVVHDVFLKVLENSYSLNPELSFYAFLQKIAQNRILDEYKKFDVHLRYKQYILINGNDTKNQTEDEIIDNEYTRLLDELIENLPPKQKEAFTRSRIEGLTYKEIAGLMQISVETVHEYISIALKKIKKSLTQHTDIHFQTIITFLIIFP